MVIRATFARGYGRAKESCADFPIYRFNDVKLPMAGLEPARAFYGPTDFKSVAFPRKSVELVSTNSGVLLKTLSYKTVADQP